MRSLEAAKRDVQAVGAVLSAPDVGSFNIEPNVVDAPSWELKDRIQNFFGNAHRSDQLLIYIACHGLLESDRFLYFASRNTNREQIARTAVAADFLCEQMVRSPSDKVMALIDCCFSGRIEEFAAAEDQLTNQLKRKIANRNRGLLILTSAGDYEIAVEGDELSVFAQAVVEGLQSGDADLDGDGYVTGMDLHGYVGRRFQELGYSQRPRLLFNKPAQDLYISKNPSRPSQFNESRYIDEVLKPYTERGRLTKDLIKRYQLRDPFNPNQSIVDMERTLNFWRDRRSSLAYGGCIIQLQEEHIQEYKPIFDEVARGDSEVLPDAIRQASHRSETLGELLEDAAGELGLVPQTTIDDLVDQGNERSVINKILRTSGIEVAVANLLPAGPPIPSYSEFVESLKRLNYPQLGDLLRPDDPGWLVGVPLFSDHKAGGNILSDGVRQAFVKHQAEAPGDPTVQDVLSLLCSLDESDLRTLFAYQIADQLKDLRRHHGTEAELVREATNLRIATSDVRQIAYAVSQDVAPLSAEAARLVALADRGKVTEAYRTLNQDISDANPPDAVAYAEKITAWHERADSLFIQAEGALEKGNPDGAWYILQQALRMVPDRSGIRNLLRQCPPKPVTAMRAEPTDNHVTITWEPSTSPPAGIEYLVRRSEESSKLGPNAGRPVSRSSGAEFVDEHPPFNRPLWYMVVPERGGMSPTSENWYGPIHVRPEVRDLDLTGEDGRVVGRWRAPDQALQIRIERQVEQGDLDADSAASDSRPANTDSIVKLHDAKPGTITEYVEDDVCNGVSYSYEISVVYRDTYGATVTTSGIARMARPAKCPDPVVISSLEVISTDPARAMIEVGRPKAGVVQIYAVQRRPPPFGTVLLRSALADMGDLLKGTPYTKVDSTELSQRIQADLPEKETWLTAVTVNGDRAAIGSAQQCRPVPPIDRDSVAVERRGDETQLSFTWPDALHEVEAHWEQPSVRRQELSYTVGTYNLHGSLRIPLTTESATISLYPVVLLPTGRLRGPRLVVGVPPLPVVEYYFEWRLRIWRFNKAHYLKTLTLIARQDIHLASIALMLSEGSFQPLRLTDGVSIRTISNVELIRKKPHSIPIGAPFNGPCWISCYVPDDGIDLRDPPPSQRRLK